MKSGYKWAFGSLAGLGLFFLTPQDLDYRDSGYYGPDSKPSAITERKDTKDTIKEGMERELELYDKIRMGKLKLLHRYLGDLDIRIIGNLTGKYNMIEVVDYLDALIEVIMEDEDLPDKYASMLEKSREYFMRGQRALRKALENESKSKKTII